MVFYKKFNSFSYQRFSDFIYDLLDHHGFWGIRFTPHDGETVFSESQLTHATSGRDINDERGFIGAWQKSPNLKKVSFIFYTRDERSSIKMTVNLDRKSISLDEAVNVSPELIFSILQRHFVFLDSNSSSAINKWWEKTWIQIIIFLGAVAGIVGLVSLLK